MYQLAAQKKKKKLGEKSVDTNFYCIVYIVYDILHNSSDNFYSIYTNGYCSRGLNFLGYFCLIKDF